MYMHASAATMSEPRRGRLLEETGTATVIRTDRIATLVELCREGDIIFLDLDDTLLSTEPSASEAWAAAFAGALETNGVPKGGAAWEAACCLWMGLQSSCEVRAVEGEATVRAMEALAAAGHALVGLTARSPEAREETAQQLESCRLAELLSTGSLGVLAPAAAGKPGGLSRPDGLKPPLIHDRGVVYCCGSRKPQGLAAFEAMMPGGGSGRVVFVDDKLSHVLALRDALHPSGRHFLGVHYTAVAASLADPTTGEVPPYALPRDSSLFAATLGSAASRAHLLNAVRLLEDTERGPLPARLWDRLSRGDGETWSALAAGVCVGTVVAAWFVRR